MPDEIEIPEAALEVKANYRDRPSPTVVAEIKAYIKETGTPHLYPGHTHTKPPQGAIVVYLGEFDLPRSHAGERNRHRWAPCPCCHPRIPWYYKDGKIAWFPEERLIRNIGGDCFKAINAAGHIEAEEAFRKEEARRKTETYLLGSLPLVPQALAAVAENATIIEDIDRVRFILSERMTRAINFNLWDHVRADGALKYEVTRNERRVDRDGTERTAQVRDFERYGPLAGFEMLKPGVKPMSDRIEKLTAKLRPLDFGGNHVEALARMGSDERTKAVKTLRAILDIGEIISEAENVRLMLSPLSLGSLNGWSRTEGAPGRIYIALSDDRTQLLLGRTEDEARPLVFRPYFFNGLRKMPPISRSLRDIE